MISSFFYDRYLWIRHYGDDKFPAAIQGAPKAPGVHSNELQGVFHHSLYGSMRFDLLLDITIF